MAEEIMEVSETEEETISVEELDNKAETFLALSKIDLRRFATLVKKKYEDKKTKEWKTVEYLYVSWAVAYKHALAFDKDFSYQIEEFGEHTLNTVGDIIYTKKVPYLETKLGYFVQVSCTIKGASKSMRLPVIDIYNKPISQPSVQDINKSHMRCLVKCLALFGLGLDFYLKELGIDLESSKKTEDSAGNLVVDHSPEKKKVVQDIMGWLNKNEIAYGDFSKVILTQRCKTADINSADLAGLQKLAEDLKVSGAKERVVATITAKKGAK